MMHAKENHINTIQAAKLIKQAETYMKMKTEGETVKQTLKTLYLEAFENEGIEAAAMAADEVLKTVKEFAFAYKKAVNDPDNFLSDFQNIVEENKNDAEKCAIWLKINAIATIAGMTDATEEACKAEYEKMISAQIDASAPEQVEILREQALNSMKNNKLMMADLERYVNELSTLADGEEAVKFLLSINGNEEEVRAIAAMLAHIQIKSGKIKNVPANTPIGTTAVMISAAHERIKVFRDLQLGKIAESVAHFLLYVLGVVVLAYLAIQGLMLGFVLPQYFMPEALWGISTVLFDLGLGHLLMKAIDQWAEDSEEIVHTGAALLSCMIGGVTKLIVWTAKHTILPVVEMGKTFAERLIKNDKEENVEVHEEVMA